MEKTAAVTVCLLWLLLLLVFPTSRVAQGESASSPSTFLVSHAEATENTWTTKTSMPTARSGLGVAVVNGKIYAIGGTDGSPLGINEEYDPSTNTWTVKKSMPTPRSHFAIAVYQNKIYVIGGITEPADPNVTGITNVVEVYDPETDMWETKTSMLTARYYLSANVVNGEIYLIGGIGVGGTLNINEVYNPATDTWTARKPILNGVHGYASAVVDNKIYVIGGENGQTISTLNQIYDPRTNTWSYGAPIPTGVKYAAAGATTGVMAPKRIYVIGGYRPYEGMPTGELETLSINQVYNPETDTWTMGAQMPTGRHGLGIAVVNDVLYAIGGMTNDWFMPFTAANQQYIPFGYGTVPPPDTTPPIISIVSPENKTYTANNVSLTFTLNELTSWIGYSLDGQANVTITGNTTLTELSDGSHSLIVYATDTAGNTGASDPVYFTIKTQQSEPSSPLWVATATVVTATSGAILLVYFAKVKKTIMKANQPKTTST